MNSLVERLWTQAANATARLPSGRNNSWETEVNFIDTFAKLVAQECTSIAQDYAAFDGFPPNDVNHIINEIKNRFEIKNEQTS
jgi:hypothetical protein